MEHYWRKQWKEIVELCFYRQVKSSIKKNTELWAEIKNQIKTINGGKPIEYMKDFMKIRFESDDNLSLGKIFNIPVMVITKYFFQEGYRFNPYPQVRLNECVYKSVDEL